MRLVTWINSEGDSRVGIRVTGKDREEDIFSAWIIDFEEGCQCLEKRGVRLPQLGSKPYRDMVSFIRHQNQTMDLANQMVESWRSGELNADLCRPEKDVKLHAPVPHPVSFRDGYCFRQHVETMRKMRGLPMLEEFDLYPTFYFSNHRNASGPGEVLAPKRLSESGLDYELELAIVLGKGGRNIPVEEADQHIFGYMILNDWSDRSIWLKHESKMSMGPSKAKDFATTFGPYLVTPDELKSRLIAGPKGNRHDLKMTAAVNDQVLSEGNASAMSWTFAQIIHHASWGTTLEAGDVIGSGTVGTGCLAELNLTGVTKNRWLKEGDQVSCRIDLLGNLQNVVRLERS